MLSDGCLIGRISRSFFLDEGFRLTNTHPSNPILSNIGPSLNLSQQIGRKGQTANGRGARKAVTNGMSCRIR
jgi:hypothetical protein